MGIYTEVKHILLKVFETKAVIGVKRKRKCLGGGSQEGNMVNCRGMFVNNGKRKTKKEIEITHT